jgi:hypothetical protein
MLKYFETRESVLDDVEPHENADEESDDELDSDDELSEYEDEDAYELSEDEDEYLKNDRVVTHHTIEVRDEPLVTAAKNGHFDVVKYLVEKRHVFNNMAPMRAIQYGHLDILEYLVNERMCIDYCQFIGRGSPLEFAARYGHLDIVKYLVEQRRQRVNQYAIDCAEQYGHVYVVEYLIDIMCTYEQDNVELVQSLFAQEIDV